MSTDPTFQQTIACLYPELGAAGPDPEKFATSIIVRALNFGSEPLAAALIEHYGMERVRVAAQEQADHLDAPTYRRWLVRLELPERSAMVERFQRMWRP